MLDHGVYWKIQSQLPVIRYDHWLENYEKLKIPVRTNGTKITVNKWNNELFKPLTHHLKSYLMYHVFFGNTKLDYTHTENPL